jgi:2-C-methyl-D-erythritol 4-phosphate cytidylyltransferase
VPLAGKPMVEWSIAAFREAESVRSIVVVAPPGHIHELGGHDIGVVAGGETRAQSVTNALPAVGTALVVVHDAARPLITAALIEDLIAALGADPQAAGAIAASRVSDTIKRAKAPSSEPGGAKSAAAELIVDSTLDRSCLWAAQTPQVFRIGTLRDALTADPERAIAATDEAMVVEAAGGRVLIHPSSQANLKVTTPLDLMIAEALLMKRPSA